MPVRVPAADQLMELCNHAHYGAAAWYARRVAKKAVAARMVALGYDAILKGSSPAFDEDIDVALIQADLDGVVRPADEDSLARSATSSAQSRPGHHPAHQRGPGPHRVHRPGQPVLRRLGSRPDVVIGARPAMGKSTIAQDFARAAAIRNKHPHPVRVAGDGQRPVRPDPVR
jgi:replicative DNA helicase